MGHFELELPCPVPVADAWAAVADVGALDSWWPGVERCTVTGDRRSCVVSGDVVIEEQIRSIDAGRRRVEYGIVAAPMPIDTHHAVLEVLDADTPDQSRLRFTVDVEPEAVATAMLPGLTPALESLCAYAVRGASTNPR